MTVLMRLLRRPGATRTTAPRRATLRLGRKPWYLAAEDAARRGARADFPLVVHDGTATIIRGRHA